MQPGSITAIYCVLIVGGSLAGGWLPSWIQLTHTRMQVLLSFVGGLMLGVGLFHLLPHGIAEAGQVDLVIVWTMAGLLVMFFLIRLFHFHQHGPVENNVCEEASQHNHPHHEHHSAHAPAHRFSWIGVAFGLSLHTLIDGVALGAAVFADAHHQNSGALSFYGLAIFLAILLHKPLDALSITSLMAAAGWTSNLRQIVNLGFAMMCPLGAAIVLLGFDRSTTQSHVVIGCALGFSAGTFLCISLADLLPELQFHTHDRVKLSLALFAGVALAYVIGFIEPEHFHHSDGPPHHQQIQEQHEHNHREPPSS